MNNKKIFLFAVLPFALMLAVGCAKFERQEENRLDYEPGNDLARLTGDAILNAIRDGDYPKFIRYFGETEHDKYPEKEFDHSQKQLKQQFGEIKAFHFLAKLDTPVVENRVWVVTFERKNSKNEPVRQELLFRIVTGMDAGKVKVLGMGFI